MHETVKIKTSSHGQLVSSLLIIYTGGTFGMAYEKDGTLVKPFDFSQILEKVPELHRLELELTFVSVKSPMDSSNFGVSQWMEIAEIIFNNYQNFDGFVVLHGTDTMAYSASALSFILNHLNKPVIFTGAQLPIGVARTDARENFITSLEIASAKKDGRPLISEVCIYFDYYLLRGNRSKKVQSNHFDAFVSENYPVLAEAGVNIEYNESALNQHLPAIDLQCQHTMNTNVAVIKLFPGIQQQFINSILEIPHLKGVVLESFGAGNSPSYPWVLKTLEKAIKKNIVIFNITQCLGGKVSQGKYETSKFLKEMGVVSGGNITFEAAITKLMYTLANTDEIGNVKKILAQPIRGEMDADNFIQ